LRTIRCNSRKGQSALRLTALDIAGRTLLRVAGEESNRRERQADVERLEHEQAQRLSALEDEHRRQLEETRRRVAAAAGGGAGGVAPPPQEPVGLRVTMEETYEEVEGAEGAFAAGLKADLAAAVSRSCNCVCMHEVRCGAREDGEVRKGGVVCGS